jgi:hypothetical protein
MSERRAESSRTPLVPARRHRVYPMSAMNGAQVGHGRLAMGTQRKNDQRFNVFLDSRFRGNERE